MVRLTAFHVALAFTLGACGGSSVDGALSGADSGGGDAATSDGGQTRDAGGCPAGQQRCSNCTGGTFCAVACPGLFCLTDASVASDGGEDAGGGDAAADASYGACFSSTGTLSSSLKACTSSSDCGYVRHMVSCCGAIEIIGVAAANVGEVTACVQAWQAHLPACGCGSNGVTTEDGKSDADGAAPLVDCVPINSGSFCQTFMP
jgi:hypothetical protein